MMAKRAREGEDEEEDDETMSSCSSRSSSFGSSNGERSVSVSPPVSPRRSGCYGRSASAKSMVSSREPGIGGMGLGVGVKVQGVGVGTLVISASSSPKCSIYKLLCIAASALPKRNGALLLIVPVMYISVMLLYMGSVYPFERGSGFNGAVVEPGGLVYRSPLLFERMWPLMIADNTSFQLKEAWRHQRTEEWVPCITRARNRGLPRSNGYIIIEANGGLNQQRTSICNAVAVAGLLNATLVIPKFLFNSIWQDSSKFGDIYDEDHFIKRLKNYVRVVREVPRHIMAQLDYKATNIYNFRVKAWSPPSYYLENVLPVLIDARVIKISPFANRLSLEVPYNIQNLRCLANYEALKFSKPIGRFSKKLVERMIKASYLTHGKYVAVHLRFEEDMVAFSCCIYDGGETEKLEMDAARERGWRDKFNRNGRIIRPGIYRRDGKCPLTPLEVGMMLRGMGFSNNTPIYLASGKIYRAQENMLPLRKMFPLLHTKETLASPEELAPFEGYSSRLAALDYTVCLHSEVFVTTQGGNFPHFLMGHRRYLFNGHAKTIKPDKRKLAYLFDNPALQWEKFKKHMQTMYRQSDVRGIEIRKANGSIFNLPVPDCMCSKMSLEQRMEDRR